MRAFLAGLSLIMAYSEAGATTKVEDPATLVAFSEAIIGAGYNCPQVVSVYRFDFQTELGVPFQVACYAGGTGLLYRVTVQPRGTVIVTPAEFTR